MKILQICSYFTDSKLYRNLFNSLENLNIESDIFYFCDSKTDISKLDEDLIISNSYKPWERFLFFVKHGKVYRDFKGQVQINDYDMTHAHSLFSNGYIANRAYRDFGKKYMVAVRRTDLYFFAVYKPYLKPLGARILKEAESIIFLSPVFLERTIEIFAKYLGEDEIRRKSHIIPNGIDEIFFDHSPEEKVLEEELRLVFIGKVADPNKNVDILLKLIDEMNEEGTKVSLKLIGDYDTRFYEKVKDNDKIKLCGRLSQIEIIKTLKEDHIYIMPSHTETFGLVYVEAMSQGLPVIYTRGQGFDGQFDEGQVGYRVGANSIREMKEAIGKIRADYYPMSQRAIAGSKSYNWPDIGKDYEVLYKKIIEENKKHM